MPLWAITLLIEKRQNQVEVKLLVLAEKIGCVIGHQFSNIHRLQEEYGIKVTLPVESGGDILLIGPADKAATAKSD